MLQPSARTWVAITLVAALPSMSFACDTTGAASDMPNLASFSLRGLSINEVSPGPLISYIELYNNTRIPVSLNGYAVETSTGSFYLDGLTAPLAPGDYFVLLQGHATEVGVSTDANTPCIIVADPTCGHVTDTVLLRDPRGVVLDAVSYGVSQDTSSRYAAAVAASQFSSGSYVNIAAEYEQAVIGRSRRHKDTNQTSDWAVRGGAHALVGSPFGPNVDVPQGEDLWIEAFQAYLSKAISQDYYGFDVVTGSYANFSGNSLESTSDQSLTVNGHLFGSDDVVLTGTVTNSLEPLDSSRYATQSSGVLVDSSGTRAITFTFRREVGGASDLLIVSARVRVGDDVHPFDLSMTRNFAGVRGNYTVALSRHLTMWSGITKTTTGSQGVVWSLQSNGAIDSVLCSASLARPYPLSDGEIGGVPTPVITTEEVALQFYSTNVNGVFAINWTQMEFEYANSIPDIVGNNMVTVFEAGLGSYLQNTTSGEFSGAGLVFPLHVTSRITAIPGGKLTNWTTATSLSGFLLSHSTATFDPIPLGEGFWEKCKRGVRWGAKAAGTVAMTSVGIAGCSFTTIGGAALGGGVTLGTLGTATPLGLAAAGGGILACAGITAGCGYVINEIWSEE